MAVVYMAPELQREDYASCGRAVDMWGLGSLALHMSSGRPPSADWGRLASKSQADVDQLVEERMPAAAATDSRIQSLIKSTLIWCVARPPAPYVGSLWSRQLRWWVAPSAALRP